MEQYTCAHACLFVNSTAILALTVWYIYTRYFDETKSEGPMTLYTLSRIEKLEEQYKNLKTGLFHLDTKVEKIAQTNLTPKPIRDEWRFCEPPLYEIVTVCYRDDHNCGDCANRLEMRGLYTGKEWILEKQPDFKGKVVYWKPYIRGL